MIRAGALDLFGRSRTAQFWECQSIFQSLRGEIDVRQQGWLWPADQGARVPKIPLQEPTPIQILEWETELFGFPATGHPLDLYPAVAWETYCPVARLGQHVGETIVTCGLVIEQRLHHQVTGELMKFLTIADWTGIVETELFASTYRSYGLATVRYPVLEIEACVEAFENGRGFSLRVLRAGKPRTLQSAQ